MTDAARSTRALIAAPTAVTVPAPRSFGGLVDVVREGGLLESGAILVPILLVGVTHAEGPGIWIAAVTYLVACAGVAIRAPARDAVGRAGPWAVVRILLAVGMVAAGQLFTGSTGLLSVVYLPIVALAAFGGTRTLLVAASCAIASHVGVEAFERGSVLEAVQRAAGFAGAVALVAYATRREVRRIERARDRLRRAVRSDRRRARQIAGVEAIGRIVASLGPTDEAFDRVVDRIADEFGYRYVTIYLGSDHLVRLRAQRGYGELVPEFGGDRGIVGRVMRTGRPAHVPDVSAEPAYWSLNPDVRSEICVPLTADGEFLGFVNVESVTRLDTTDLRVMVAIADRLSAAIVIGRERERLAARAELFRHVHGFSEAINGTLQPDALYRAIVAAVPTVVPAEAAALHVLDRESGRYVLVGTQGPASAVLPAEARIGEDVVGRAIRDRCLVIDDALRPAPTFEGPEPPRLAAASPILRDGAVLGVLTLLRAERGHRFSGLDQDALAMLAEQAAMALANVRLHAEVAELALRDPLTGLFNRRYLDPALEQLFARRARLPVHERVPLAAIMFDLDHFSELNNRHGHQVGDEVLRAFGGVLRSRMRSTDLVARFGGEEFAAILFRATLDDAVRIADEVRAQLAATPIAGVSGEELSATVSAGCAVVQPEEEAPESLLRAADVALYMAKRAGRDRVCAA